MNNYLFPEIFCPPIIETKPLPPAVKFQITIGDGSIIDAVFEYIVNEMPHYEFHGDALSETGYRSCFIGLGVLPEDEIVPLAIKCANKIRAEHLIFLKKEKRKAKRGKRGV